MTISLDAPVEQLLTAGSDNRLLTGPDGLNPYGCSPVPRGTIGLGNCTCSSPSARGMSAARLLLSRLREAADPQAEVLRVCAEQRSQLKTLLAVPEKVDVAFTPSGTDVELLVLALSAGNHDRPIVNVIVGPTEVGSGTMQAAAGCHYDTLVPSGRTVVAGTPVSARLASRCTVQTVDIRDAHGRILSEVVIDAIVTEVVAESIAAGAHVIVHLVAHSKTGMHAPSLACVDRISRHLGEDVTIVIDAAQGRVSRRGLREILDSGHLVMFTGSKFYGGPPFSGALLIPPRWQPDNRGLAALPEGFEDYFTAAEFPETWTPLRRALPARRNYGALLRWGAALAEIEAYYEVSNESRLRVLRAFEEIVPGLFENSPTIRMLPVFPPLEDESQTRLLESKTTVFAFRVLVDGEPLSRDALKVLHRELNTDVSRAYAHLPPGVMSYTVHLGQPVPFADGSAALRIALGGEMIVRVATDTALGSSLAERINWLGDQLRYLRTKLEFLAAERASVPAETLRA